MGNGLKNILASTKPPRRAHPVPNELRSRLRPGPAAAVYLTGAIGVWSGDGINTSDSATFPHQIAVRSGHA
jgi:hypothetical protein